MGDSLSMKRFLAIICSLFLTLSFISCASISFFTDNIENEVDSSEVVLDGREAKTFTYTRNDFLKMLYDVANRTEYFSCYRNSVGVYEYGGSRKRAATELEYINTILVFDDESVDSKYRYPKVLCFGTEDEAVEVFYLSNAYLKACDDQDYYNAMVLSNFLSGMGNDLKNIGNAYSW
jgi:hypothetical protein